MQDSIQKIYRWMHNLDWYRGNETITKHSFFLGDVMPSRELTMCDITWKHFVKYEIYNCRMRKKLPCFGPMRVELTEFQMTTGKLNWWKYERNINGNI